ncbi:hypothetical protein [Taklimakanibacter deserti]|uniref:hypothetical protein n=1 Tax=Taklimakanibacter deserti TaxID=2267839 RepID=UPI000E649586
MQWNSTYLLNKSKLFAKYARDTDRSSGLYGLWSSLYLELLARAALAKIHPSLLADPQDGKSFLYGFGVEKKDPASIAAKILYQRCTDLVSGFDEQALSHCLLMARARNIEVHTGEASFETMTHNRWQSEQYRVVTILADFLNAEVTDFFERDEAEELEDRLKNMNKEVEGRAKDDLRKHREWFNSLSAKDQTDAREYAQKEIAALIRTEANYAKQGCPACGSEGVLLGEKILGIKVTIDGEMLIQKTSVASKKFICKACKLDLSREYLTAVQLPASFTVSTEVDPMEHFGIDPADYMETDEMIRQLERHGMFVYEQEYDNE